MSIQESHSQNLKQVAADAAQKTLNLRYGKAVIVPRDFKACCLRTTNEVSYLRIVNLDPDQKATFVLVADSDYDGTYTLNTDLPGSSWILTTNFIAHQLTVYNLSAGAASIEVMLLDSPQEY